MWVWFGVWRFGFGLWRNVVDKWGKGGDLLVGGVVEKFWGLGVMKAVSEGWF
jgi:hypothetical protein